MSRICSQTCALFYQNPNATTLGSGDPRDPLTQGCGYCMYYNGHMQSGKASCQTQCNIDGIVNENPNGFATMQDWCKAASCIKDNYDSCPVMYPVMFGTTIPAQANALYNKACGNMQEKFCVGCADSSFNYFGLNSAYKFHPPPR